MEKSSYRDLFVWREGVELANRVLAIADRIRTTHRYGLSNQMERSSVSVSSNIAEGASRSGRRDWKRFLEIARGSLWELDTQLEICRRRNLVSERELSALRDRINQIGSGLNKLIARAAEQIRAQRIAARASRQLKNSTT